MGLLAVEANYSGGRVTCLASNISTGTSVVIKQFQFSRAGASWSGYQAHSLEVKVLQQLNHPSIPSYLDAFETPDSICLVQEYIPACSLANSRLWTLEEVKQIAISVLQTLAYLQSSNPPVIHRDIKPENILVERQEQLKVYLIDFGFAHSGDRELAASSVVKGTLGFMPPEQIYNRSLTLASDLYSLGATLICLLTGTKSTAIGDLIDDSGKIQFRSLVPDLDVHFVDWLEKMTVPSPSLRFKNASVALAALEKIDRIQLTSGIDELPKEAVNNRLWLNLKRAASNLIETVFIEPLEPGWQTKLRREDAPLEDLGYRFSERTLLELSIKILGKPVDNQRSQFLAIRDSWLNKYNKLIEREPATVAAKQLYSRCRLKEPEVIFIDSPKSKFLEREKLVFDRDTGPSVKAVLLDQLLSRRDQLWKTTKNTIGDNFSLGDGYNLCSLGLFNNFSRFDANIGSVVASLSKYRDTNFNECLEAEVHPSFILMEYYYSLGLNYNPDTYNFLMDYYQHVNWIFPYKNVVFIVEKPPANFVFLNSRQELLSYQMALDGCDDTSKNNSTHLKDNTPIYLFYRGVLLPNRFAINPKFWDISVFQRDSFKYNPIFRCGREYEILLEVLCSAVSQNRLLELAKTELSSWQQCRLCCIEIGSPDIEERLNVHLLEIKDASSDRTRIFRVPPDITKVKKAINWCLTSSIPNRLTV